MAVRPALTPRLTANWLTCQHTFATLALSAGENIGGVAKQMGRGSTKMVIEHYDRFIPNNARQDGSAFDRAVAGLGSWTAESTSETARGNRPNVL